MGKRLDSATHSDIQRLLSITIDRLQELKRSLTLRTLFDLRLRFLQLTLIWFLLKLSQRCVNRR
jgi:hypothetical protein